MTTLNREYEKSKCTQHVSDSKNEGETDMKCEHGNEITVSSVFDIDKDYYNEEGNVHKQDDGENYLLIYGCDKCKRIKVNFDKIDPELSKRSVSGINNIISPHDIIDKIWSEEDDTI